MSRRELRTWFLTNKNHGNDSPFEAETSSLDGSFEMAVPADSNITWRLSFLQQRGIPWLKECCMEFSSEVPF